MWMPTTPLRPRPGGFWVRIESWGPWAEALHSCRELSMHRWIICPLARSSRHAPSRPRLHRSASKGYGACGNWPARVRHSLQLEASHWPQPLQPLRLALQSLLSQVLCFVSRIQLLNFANGLQNWAEECLPSQFRLQRDTKNLLNLGKSRKGKTSTRKSAKTFLRDNFRPHSHAPDCL